MKQRIIVFWFRRDLRLHDNHGLYKALKQGNSVLPVFIFDRNILDKLPSKNDMRVSFIYEHVKKLKQSVEKYGSSLKVYNSTPALAFRQLLDEYDVISVFTNKDYEPYTRKRDNEIENLLQKKGIGFNQFKDHVIFDENDVMNNYGNPYTVFTPYSRKWISQFFNSSIPEFPSGDLYNSFLKTPPFTLPPFESLGFINNYPDVPPPEVPEDIIQHYKDIRDFPAMKGTTRLGIHLRYGTISIRELTRKAANLSEVFLKELIWREFFISILWHFPHVVTRAFKSQFENIRWRNNEIEFEKWCHGMTGYPMVDAGMRELKATGFMHNRVRMIVAGFLTRHLLIDWRWGEAFFAEKLLDYELASNNGNWQWAAGTGCDGAPWFRIFNPQLQQKKFDPDSTYVKRWIPELGTSSYPEPIVDYKLARERALAVFKAALHE